MIPLSLAAVSDAEHSFVTRLRTWAAERDPDESVLLDEEQIGATFVGPHGLIAIDGATASELDGDVVLVQPSSGRAERLLRAGSRHNTLLVTERCDQLCVMCSQPPKKTHVDRFKLLEQAALLAEHESLIGITGGEPTLYKEQLLEMLERVLAARPDLRFHVLSNGQHFERGDVERLRDASFRRVTWGIPLYSTSPDLHDRIVGKGGAYERLQVSFAHLLRAGARIELRTVLLSANVHELPAIAELVSRRLRFVESWSIMQLENIGFARRRWADLRVDHSRSFEPIAAALDHSALHGVRAQLFNFPLCTVPERYRHLAPPSISDWKRKLLPACSGCRAAGQCSGFFEWHPSEAAMQEISPL